jgi:PAS domain S-box-containing protein
MKLIAKLVILMAVAFLVQSPKPAHSSLLSSHDLSGNLVESGDLSDLIPFSNIKVYKRWNEEDISWKAWFRRGSLPVVIFLVTSFCIIFLLFYNNSRLNKIVKKNYQDLWEAEEHYYRLLETVRDAVIIIEQNSKKIVTVNREAEAFTGYKREDLIDMNINSITLSSEEKKISDYLKTIEYEGHVIKSEISVLDNEKRVKQAACKGRLIKGYNKTVILLTLSEI